MYLHNIIGKSTITMNSGSAFKTVPGESEQWLAGMAGREMFSREGAFCCKNNICRKNLLLQFNFQPHPHLSVAVNYMKDIQQGGEYIISSSVNIYHVQ